MSRRSRSPLAASEVVEATVARVAGVLRGPALSRARGLAVIEETCLAIPLSAWLSGADQQEVVQALRDGVAARADDRPVVKTLEKPRRRSYNARTTWRLRIGGRIGAAAARRAAGPIAQSVRAAGS